MTYENTADCHVVLQRCIRNGPVDCLCRERRLSETQPVSMSFVTRWPRKSDRRRSSDERSDITAIWRLSFSQSLVVTRCGRVRAFDVDAGQWTKVVSTQ